MKTRWIEKRQTPPHNNQPCSPSKKNDRAKGKEKER